MINAFVYGTLRVGEHNYGWASGDVIDEIVNVTTTGGIYFVSSDGGYPVAKLDEPGTIIGDVLVYPEDSRDWSLICQMEEGAGYELREIEVTLVNGLTMPAVAWHYKREPWGSRIEDGDWSRALRQQYRTLSEIS